jgi:prolyl 4-hydroxylase
VAAASSREPWVEQLGWRPRAWLYHNFLTPEECAHLIDLARPAMERSSVVDNASGKSVDSEIRTSAGMFFRRGQDDVIRAIEDRIAAFSMVPADHGEGLQVLHYLVSQRGVPTRSVALLDDRC